MGSRVWRAGVSTAVLGLAACGWGGDIEPPADWSSFEQTLELDIEGHAVPVALEGMDVWLTEDDEWPETFEIKGAGVSLGGTFPDGVRVGYEDDWNALVGRAIPIQPRHGLPGEEKPSIVTLPGVGPVQVLGGQFTIDRVDADFDAKTPVTGSVELRVRGGAGEVALKGRLAVKGTGWG